MKLPCAFILMLFGAPAWSQRTDSTFLYLKCGNELSLTQLAPGYHPAKNSITVKGARLLNNTDNDRVVVIPDSSVVVISLKGVASPAVFYSKNPPKPIFEVVINQMRFSSFLHEANGQLPISIGVEPLADESFRMMVPKDTRYRISQWEISQRRGNEAVNRIIVNGNTLPASDLNKIRSTARPGDVLEITVIAMKRQNLADEMINQDLTEKTFAYTITNP